ncbi:MAG: TRAM domain-containing protein [Patescibacteria group bacterium]|nr:TRAM domain-containing protein [Patescibacteria group bacterium]
MDYIIVIGIIIIILILVNGKKPKQINGAKTKPTSGAVILDSCALIDGRVVELTKLGFISQQLVVPNFILQELQLLADGRDSHKRERARFGLQVVKQLQNIDTVDVRIEQYNPEKPTVDEKLVGLAKELDAQLFTTDYNLNQVASIDGVRVLNVNELAHSLRPVVLPGEELEISITQSGTNREQGVGYLEDGTMVVVDGAIRDIGKRIKVHITKSHQTVAGKMLFAKKLADHKTPNNRSSSNRYVVNKSKLRTNH